MTGTLNRVRVGVIGVGQIGKRHVETYAKMNNVELVAIADLNEPEAQRVGAQWNIPHVYTDFRGLLARDDIQAVDVCLHNNYHMPVTVAALEAGKDVFCEKPMAGAYVDALTDVGACPGHGPQVRYSVRHHVQQRDQGSARISSTAATWGSSTMFAPAVIGAGAGPMWMATAARPLCRSSIRLAARSMIWASTISPPLLYLIGNPAVERISGKTYQVTAMDASAPRRQQLRCGRAWAGLHSFCRRPYPGHPGGLGGPHGQVRRQHDLGQPGWGAAGPVWLFPIPGRPGSGQHGQPERVRLAAAQRAHRRGRLRRSPATLDRSAAGACAAHADGCVRADDDAHL